MDGTSMYAKDGYQEQILGATCSTWLTYAPSAKVKSLYWSRLQAQIWQSELGKYEHTVNWVPCAHVSA